MAQTAQLGPEGAKRPSLNSRQQDALVSVIRTANYLRRSGISIFEKHGTTPQQYNVLRILRGAGAGGLPTLEIAARMIEEAPGITRLLDRLESKKLVRRERPVDNRRQVLCYITRAGLDLVHELDAPLKDFALRALQKLSKSDLEELMRLLALARNESPQK